MSPFSDAMAAELMARQQIHDVLIRYCRGADRCDAAMMKSCFHEDAWDDHGFFSGPANEFAEQAAKNLRERFTSVKHYMTNEYVEIDGDQAKSETYILALTRMVRDGSSFDVFVSARYLDRLERRNDVWKIVHRLLVSDGTRIDKVVEDDPRLNQGKAGTRGSDDPSYAFFGLDQRA